MNKSRIFAITLFLFLSISNGQKERCFDMKKISMVLFYLDFFFFFNDSESYLNQKASIKTFDSFQKRSNLYKIRNALLEPRKSNLEEKRHAFV
jgi:hypothetical protein